MQLTYAQISCTGPIRSNNEDAVEHYVPTDLDEMRGRGAFVAIADGVGGQGHGEKASALAISSSLKAFKEARLPVQPGPLIRQMYYSANTAVYDEGMIERSEGRMATTLTVLILRNNEVHVGHVGDCRLYLIRRGTIKRITTDHSYVGMQLRLGLISEKEAMESDKRSLLTRSIGQNITVIPDTYTQVLYNDDVLVLCSDGLHGWVTESEVLDAIQHFPNPLEACQFLVGLAEKHQSEDNISVQVIRIEKVEQVALFHGRPYYLDAAAHLGSELQIGDLLDSRFLLVDSIARTETCCIFKASDTVANTTVAIKVPLTKFQNDPEFLKQMEREEQIGLSMNHPNVLRVIPVEKKSRPYMVMEFLEGQTLSGLLQNVKTLPPRDALRIAATLCGALDYMHRRRINVIHRDLKPANIMICQSGGAGDAGSVRIMDFGIARATGSRSFKYAGYAEAFGTPDYLAPEQVKGEAGDERTDVYSMGAILYEMVAGKTPFDGESAYEIMNARLQREPVPPRKLNPDIPAVVEEIILHAMEREPNDRFNSAAEMQQALENTEKVVVTERTAHKPTIESVPPKSRSASPYVLLVMVIVLALAIILMYVFRPATAPRPATQPDAPAATRVNLSREN